MKSISRSVCFSLTLLAIYVPQTVLGVFNADALSPLSDEQHRFVSLIEQLADEEFVNRKAAEGYLLSLGSAAIDQLSAATAHHNVEIRYRAQRLLTILKQRQLQSLNTSMKSLMVSLSEHIPSFLEGSTKITLPGWERFQSFAGNSPDSRRLFACMLRAEPQLLLIYATAPDYTALSWSSCLAQYQHGQHPLVGKPPVSAAMAMVWVSLDGSIKLHPQQTIVLITVLSNVSVPDAEQLAENPATHRLLRSWIEQLDAQQTSLSSKLELAKHFNLKIGVPIAAIKILVNNAAIPFELRPAEVAAALWAVAKEGDSSHIKYIKPLLKDATKYHANAQLRDAALGALLLITGQDLKDYGLIKLTGSAETHGMLSLATEIAPGRDKVLARWQAWAKENLKPEEGDAAESQVEEATAK